MATGTVGGALDKHIFDVTIGFHRGTNACQTGFSLRDLAVNDNSPEDVSDAVVPWVTNFFRPLLTTADSIDFVDVKQVASTEGFTHPFVNTFGSMNPSSFVRTPAFLCVAIALKTQRRARYGQGRMYWPIPSEDWMEADVVNATGAAAYQGAIDDLVSNFSGSVLTHDLALVNHHGLIAGKAATTTSPARPEIPPSWYDVDVVKLSTLIRSLRSRRTGQGS